MESYKKENSMTVPCKWSCVLSFITESTTKVKSPCLTKYHEDVGGSVWRYSSTQIINISLDSQAKTVAWARTVAEF